jgi:hypothetical protein
VWRTPQIRVRDVNTNEIRTARSSGEGEYTVSSLPPGTYEAARTI